MNNTIWKLHNVIKDYDWGTTTALSALFNIDNPNQSHQAEIWMGAHPAGSSTVMDAEGKQIKLDDLIAQNPPHILGQQTYKTYHALPFLFKVLSAQSSLSIQVHPELSKAKLGYEKENKQGIPLNSPKRNYKDPNHKPELLYAITSFWAMNGFRPITEILSLFTKLNLQIINDEIAILTDNQSDKGLQRFFHYLLTLDNHLKQQAIFELRSSIEIMNERPFSIIKEIAQKYPDDIGLFMPLILNVIQLKPGQAMYLHAETPHAYLQGTGLEIMANSDNVLRAGLTPKYIDIQELLANTNFNSIPFDKILTSPQYHDNKIDFPVPVDDFKFAILNSDSIEQIEKVTGPEILFCIHGKVIVTTTTDTITLSPGESVFIAYAAGQYSYSGKGQLARAFN